MFLSSAVCVCVCVRLRWSVLLLLLWVGAVILQRSALVSTGLEDKSHVIEAITAL